jgi:hypothetical protein
METSDAQMGDDFIDRYGRSRDLKRNPCACVPRRYVRALHSHLSIAELCHAPKFPWATPRARDTEQAAALLRFRVHGAKRTYLPYVH